MLSSVVIPLAVAGTQRCAFVFLGAHSFNLSCLCLEERQIQAGAIITKRFSKPFM